MPLTLAMFCLMLRKASQVFFPFMFNVFCATKLGNVFHVNKKVTVFFETVTLWKERWSHWRASLALPRGRSKSFKTGTACLPFFVEHNHSSKLGNCTQQKNWTNCRSSSFEAFAEREGFFLRYASKATASMANHVGSHPLVYTEKLSQDTRCTPWLSFAEREGFEPTVRKAYNGFRDRPDRPLRHLS